MDDLSRRDAIKLGAAVTLTASLDVGVLAQPATFFTRDELALVDELSELIIPADEHSGGAKAAQVAAYLDARLAESQDETRKRAWRDGLKPFAQLPPDQRLALLTRMARNEGKPHTSEERFFAELKASVVQAYYTSKVGIRDEMEYKGNSGHAEFAGFDVTGE